MADLPAKLYHAVDDNNVAELLTLIEAGADVDQFYDDLSHANSKTLLHFACAKGRDDCVKTLLENGASVNVRDKWRMTPIIFCISTCNYTIAKMLIEKDQSTVNSQDTNGKTPLHIAVIYGSQEAMVMLLGMGSDINLQNFNGYTPLMSLMAAKDIPEYMPLMKVLIGNDGVDVHIADFRDKRTALHIAVITKKVDAVEKLLDSKADPNQLDISGNIPLTCLLSNLNPIRNHATGDVVMAIALLLTQAGTNLDMANVKSENNIPLLMAARATSKPLLRLLLDYGADVNVTAPFTNVTPLFIAVKQNDIGSVKVLLNWSCKLDIAGRCSLRHENSLELVDYELDPFELSIRLGYWNIVKLFLQHGYNVSRIPFLRNSYNAYCENDIPNSLRNNAEMLQYLRYCGKCPFSLLTLCTIAIFKRILSNVTSKLDVLPLPRSIVKFLKIQFSDV